MNDHKVYAMKYEYLNAVEQRLKKEKSKKTILAELEAHINDKIDYYLDLGYSKEEAEKRAIEEMGDPDDAALPLRELHKKTYTTTLMFVTLSYVFLVYIIESVVPMLRYSSGYTFILGERAGYPHNIFMDFISFAIVAGFAVLLYLGYRQKSISVPIIIAVSLLVMIFIEWTLYHLIDGLQIIISDEFEEIGYLLLGPQMINRFQEFVPCAVFQPFIFAIAMIISSGFNGYIGSLFAECYLDVQQKGICKLGAVVLCLFFVGWAVYQLILVLAQTRMKRTKTGNKVMRVSVRVIAGFLAVYLSVVLICTGISYTSRADDKARALKEKSVMINEVLTCSPDLLSAETFLSKGYKPYLPGKNDIVYRKIFGVDSYFYKTKTNNLIEFQPIDEFTSTVEFHSTQGVEPLTKEEFNRINGNGIQTFGDFLELGLLDRATDIVHVRYGTGDDYGGLENNERFEIKFNYQGDDKKVIYCNFNVFYKSNDPRPDIKDYELEYVMAHKDDQDYADSYISYRP